MISQKGVQDRGGHAQGTARAEPQGQPRAGRDGVAREAAARDVRGRRRREEGGDRRARRRRERFRRLLRSPARVEGVPSRVLGVPRRGPGAHQN